MLMLAEWWAAESIILLGGSLRNGPLNVAVLSIYQTVNAVAYMVSYGVHVAANTRVGNHLGRYATFHRTYTPNRLQHICMIMYGKSMPNRPRVTVTI